MASEDATPRRASFSHAGMFRCCIGAIPVDDSGYVLAGEEGEYRACPAGCKREDLGGIHFLGGVWVSGATAQRLSSVRSGTSGEHDAYPRSEV